MLSNDLSRPRVMVSSVIDGFSEFREAARRGIIAAGGEPVLVNEDFPSTHLSPRNACLDAVDSVDVLLSIVGDRGGWTAPSAKLVVEEEYERALTRKIPVIALIQEVKRDQDAERFASRLSNYVDGFFRRGFATAPELEQEIVRALKPLLERPHSGGTMRSLRKVKPNTDGTNAGAPVVRLHIMPEREEEVFDPVTIGSENFLNQIYRLGHSADVGLLSYESAKKAVIDGECLLVKQYGGRGGHQSEYVELRLFQNGEVVIDGAIQHETYGRAGDMSSMFVLAAEDFERVLNRSFRFAAVLFDEFDKFKRHSRFIYNVELRGLGFRTLERNPRPRSGGYTVRVHDRDPLVPLPEPRVISRGDLTSPKSEIERVTALLLRQTAT